MRVGSRFCSLAQSNILLFGLVSLRFRCTTYEQSGSMIYRWEREIPPTNWRFNESIKTKGLIIDFVQFREGLTNAEGYEIPREGLVYMYDLSHRIAPNRMGCVLIAQADTAQTQTDRLGHTNARTHAQNKFSLENLAFGFAAQTSKIFATLP